MKIPNKFVFMLLFMTSFYAKAQDLTAGEWLEKAKQTSEPTQQILLFSRAIKIDENLTAAYYGRGLARLKKELSEDAVTDFDIAISLEPKPEYFGSRGEAYASMAKYEVAVADFTTALKAKPSDTKILSQRAYAFVELQNYASALADYESILIKSPADVTALNGKGLALLNQGQLDASLRCFESALKYDPQNIAAWGNKGLYFEKKKDYASALSQYEKTLSLKKTYEPALNGKRRVLKGMELANKPTPKATPPSSPSPAADPYSNFPQLSNFKKKYALIIGNAGYKHYSPLDKFPINDANDISSKLKEEFGFETIVITNAGYDAFTKALVEFYKKIENADVAMVFYAGHGVEFNGLNYLIPTDKKVDAESAEFEAISVQKTMQSIQQKNVNYTVLVIDACRNGRGMITKTDKVIAPSNARNFFIAYATSSGKEAQNGNTHNGIYTQELLKCIKKGERIDDVFMKTRAQVMKVTGDAQAPENTVGLTSPFVF
jgi:tetratricopeptide (TPR) repeat protein